MTTRELSRAARAVHRRDRLHQDPTDQRLTLDALAALDLMSPDADDSRSLDVWPACTVDAGPFDSIEDRIDF